MFTFWQLARVYRASGINLKVSLYCDAANKEASLTVTADGRLQTRFWRDPKWWEVDTPAKAEAWFKRIDLDTMAYNLRNATREMPA